MKKILLNSFMILRNPGNKYHNRIPSFVAASRKEMDVNKWISILVLFFILVQTSCDDDQEDNPTLPDLETSSISNITANSAISGGVIIDPGDGNISQKGVCWSTDPNPTLDDEFTQDGNGDSDFTSQMEGLQESTTYFVRSYAQSEFGLSYGNQLEFTTSSSCRLKTISTPSNSSTTDLTYEYDVLGRIGSVIFNLKDGGNFTEDYQYEANGDVKITFNDNNGSSLSTEMTFEKDTLKGFRKDFSTGFVEVSKTYYLSDTAVVFVSFNSLGPDNSLIPIDSAIFIFNEDRNIDKLLVFNKTSNPQPYPTGTYTFVFDDFENPYRELLTNFRTQGSYLQYARHFNSQNIISAFRDGVLWTEYTTAYDESLNKTISITNETAGIEVGFTYENCD